MTIKTYAALTTDIGAITNESLYHGNTRTRVGGTLQNLLDSQQSINPLRIMACGDSITAGNGGADANATAWRENFWNLIRARRSNVEMRGGKLIGRFGQNTTLQDWRAAAQGGYTIQLVDGLATAAEALGEGVDIYVVMCGTNNISLGDTVEQMTGYMNTLIANRLAANPNAFILLCTVAPRVHPADNHEALNVATTAWNAALPSIAITAGPRVQVVQAGSLLSAGHMVSDGVHPNSSGFAVIARAIADAVLQLAGVSGSPVLRPITRRVAKAALVLDTNTDTVAWGNDAALIPTGGASFGVGLRFRPSTIDTAETEVQILGSYLVATAGRGWFITQLDKYLGLKNPGGGGNYAPTTGGVADFFRANQWHQIVLSFNATTKLVQMFAHRLTDAGIVETSGSYAGYQASVWDLAGTGLELGTGANWGGYGAQGAYNDLWTAVGYAPTWEDAERWCLDDRLPGQVTAYYELNENTGTNLNPVSGFTGLPVGAATGTAWSAAGAIATPWDIG